MKDIRIRTLEVKDREEMNTFLENVLIHTFNANGFGQMQNLIEDEIKDKHRYVQQFYDSGGKDRFFLVAVLDNHIVGCIEYGAPNDLLNSCTNNALADIPEIGTVFVDPDYHRKGIATLMLKNIFERLRCENVKTVCLDSGYPIAQSIWTKLFGTPQYFLKDYWDKDAHHMVWVIDIENLTE